MSENIVIQMILIYNKKKKVRNIQIIIGNIYKKMNSNIFNKGEKPVNKFIIGIVPLNT